MRSAFASGPSPRARASLALASAAIAAVVAGGMAAAQQEKMPRPSGDRPVEDRIASFERDERVARLKPDEVVRALDLHDGMVIADIGAGSGLFSRPFARAVGPKGKVYAVDISADILEYVRERAKRENLANLEVIVSKDDDPMLPPHAVDLAFFCDTTHHIANRVPFYKKMIAGLKDGARVAVIDYDPEAAVKGWSSHKPEELVPRSQAIAELEQAGFRFVKKLDILPHNYFLLFVMEQGGAAARPPGTPSRSRE
jgi:arsenite methyltransferase